MTPEETTVQVLLLWALALSTFINVGSVIWNLFSGPSKKNAATLEEHGKALNVLSSRLGTLESAQREMPNRKDFHDLEVTMTDLKGTMAVLTERLKPVEAMTDRLQEWIIEQGKK